MSTRAEVLIAFVGRPPYIRAMKALSFAAILFLSVASLMAKPGWSDDYAASLAKAKADGKMVLLDFTGSDWCGWCKKLKAEVFSTDDFANYAKTNLVLVEVDFPRNKQLSAAQTTANMALQAKYSVQGYPTIIVLNSQGTKVAQLGYQPGGPKPFIARLDKVKSQK